MFLFMFSGVALAQQAAYRLPKFPPKYKLRTRDIGPKPGTAVTVSSPRTERFRRVYTSPAGLRLLVRVNCGASVTSDDLIKRAQEVSPASGGPVQIDWSPIRGDKVSFWVVTSLARRVVDVNLVAKDGKYQIKDKNTQEKLFWQVERLTFAEGKNCIEEKNLSNKDISVAVINALNQHTIKYFRKNPYSE